MEQLDKFIAMASAYGITVNEAASAAERLAQAAKEAVTDEEMAALIQMNNSMTRLQKRRLIRDLQKRA